MTKMKHHKGYGFAVAKTPSLQRTRKPEIIGLRFVAAKPPSSRRSEVFFPLRELEKTLAFWAIDEQEEGDTRGRDQ